MRGLQKSKRVSWASDLNLCQVKLFLSDDSPSQVGLGGQDHMQAKAWHSGGAATNDNLPPGFEGTHPSNLFQNKLSQIPLVKWKCPSRFVLDPTWQVTAGEESKEVEVETQREMRVLEAVYPRPSAIPPNPASPMSEPYNYTNHHTPVVPITPIEDDDMAPDTSPSIPPTSENTIPPPGAVPGVEPDVVSAAYSALTAAMSNTTQGNLIDPNLLIKLLSDPTLIEKLVSTHGSSTSSQQISQPPPTLPPAMSLSEPPPPPPAAHARPPHLPFSTSHYPPPTRSVPGHGHVPVSAASLPPQVEVNVKKDINYYKSLIQQHGGENQEPANNNDNISSNHITRDMKPKVMKPCMYYNSARGCRHGASCVFQHESGSQRVSGLPDAQSAKRMKMDREITGT